MWPGWFCWFRQPTQRQYSQPSPVTGSQWPPPYEAGLLANWWERKGQVQALGSALQTPPGPDIVSVPSGSKTEAYEGPFPPRDSSE